MHVLFVHQNFPAQFGHIAVHLDRKFGWRSTFVSEKPPGRFGGVERIQYAIMGGATESTHYHSRTFENAVWHADAVYRAMKARPDVRPDLVVGHSGFGSTLYLRDLYDCPIINYFEYFYHVKDSDMDFRPDFPCPEEDKPRARTRNAMVLLDLENCDAGYSPTAWQRDLMPLIFRDKVRVVFDGVDTDVWKPMANLPRRIGATTIPEDMKIVTYVARGMESMRGFDVFMKMAKILGGRRKDVLFVVVGQDRVCYGGDLRHTGGKTFKEWVLSNDDYDLGRFLFTGLLATTELAGLFSLSDLHVYLTVPFVLSWSLMDALACGTTVLASDTAPVREMIRHGENGLLTDFFDAEAMAEAAGRVLDHPEEYRHLGTNATAMIREKYSLDACLPRIVELYRGTVETR